MLSLTAKMDVNEPFQYAMSLAPIQVLLLLTENELKCRKLFERREVKRVLDTFKNKTVKEIIGYQLPDYRVELYNHLLYLESADYLLTQKDVMRFTDRQLLLLKEYLFRFTHRSTSNIEKKLTDIMTLNTEKLSVAISSLINDPQFKTETVISFRPFDIVIEQTAGPLRPAQELTELFLKHGFVSQNFIEAKAICAGLGLHPSVNWYKIEDYHFFVQLMCNRIPNCVLYFFNVEHVINYSKKGTVINPCIICFENPINTIHLPCFHAALCQQCANVQLTIKNTCIVCRAEGCFHKIYISA
jgi:hypothetical protein